MRDKEIKKTYHHGDLRRAILDGVLAQIRDGGPEAVSLRAAARAAGVSPGATFRHFADKRAVMTALAAEGYAAMQDRIAMERAAADDTPLGRLGATGRGYLRFALDHPALFRIMFRTELLDEDDPALQATGGAVKASLFAGIDAARPDLDPDTRRKRALLAWGVVHGLATLAIEGALDGDVPREGREDALAALLAGMGPALAA